MRVALDSSPGAPAGSSPQVVLQAFGFAEAEHPTIVEVMARHQLMQLSGQIPDSTRHKLGLHSHRDLDGGA